MCIFLTDRARTQKSLLGVDSAMPVIPWPAQYETSTGHFSLPEEVYISYAGEGTEKTANLLREQLEDRLQLSCSVAPASDIGDSAAIHLARETEAVASLASAPNQEEGYELNIREAQVVIRGNEPHGVFNGVQTLLQMLPAFPAEGGVSLDCVTVRSSTTGGSKLSSPIHFLGGTADTQIRASTASYNSLCSPHCSCHRGPTAYFVLSIADCGLPSIQVAGRAP